MAIRSILTAENALLRKKSKKVKRFGASLQALVDDMRETLAEACGLGLAAPQIGVLQRVFIVDMPAEVDEEGIEVTESVFYVLVNPQIVKARGEEEMEEGCLSVPGYRGRVNRALDVTIKGQDLSGKPVRHRASDLLAQAFQHELDHLDGVLYLDRLESPDNLWRIDVSEEEEAPVAAS